MLIVLSSRVPGVKLDEWAVSIWTTASATAPRTRVLKSVLLRYYVWECKLRVASKRSCEQLFKAGMWLQTAAEVIEVADPDFRVEWHRAQGPHTV